MEFHSYGRGSLSLIFVSPCGYLRLWVGSTFTESDKNRHFNYNKPKTLYIQAHFSHKYSQKPIGRPNPISRRKFDAIARKKMQHANKSHHA